MPFRFTVYTKFNFQHSILWRTNPAFNFAPHCHHQCTRTVHTAQSFGNWFGNRFSVAFYSINKFRPQTVPNTECTIESIIYVTVCWVSSFLFLSFVVVFVRATRLFIRNKTTTKLNNFCSSSFKFGSNQNSRLTCWFFQKSVSQPSPYGLRKLFPSQISNSCNLIHFTIEKMSFLFDFALMLAQIPRSQRLQILLNSELYFRAPNKHCKAPKSIKHLNFIFNFEVFGLVCICLTVTQYSFVEYFDEFFFCSTSCVYWSITDLMFL